MSIHGSAYPAVSPSQAKLLHKQLDEAGVKNKLLIIPDRKHGNFNGRQQTQIFEEIWEFLESAGMKTTCQ